MSTTTTGQLKSEESERMGVASLNSNKRRLENPGEGDEDYVAVKLAKKANSVFIEQTNEVQVDTIGNENSSDFLTTSILARTLLTSTATGTVGVSHGATSSMTPLLESMNSTLEALPAPSLLLGSDEIRSTFLPFKTTIQEATDLEFTSLLCHEGTLSTVTVLSPIDEDSGEWSTGSSSTTTSTSSRKTNKNPPNCLSSVSDQVITEDETGKSYFNLGSADTTILVKKNSSSSVSSSSSSSSSSMLSSTPSSSPVHLHNSLGGGSDQSWTNCNNSDFIDDGSSSSCESISSEDLFTSEEFDASEDEEELRSYKQQRSNVLHISLCKLSSFRTQQCVEPSLHRSVLICNTLRHIEQEIRNEDEIPIGGTHPLPSFWATSNNNNNNNNNHNSTNNNNNNNNNTNNVNSLNQPQITDIRPPNQSHIASLHGHDPYLSPNLYNSNNTESPYTSYDYNSLRPNPTPFHTASYDYEQDLGSPSSGALLDVTSSSLLECDSGYAEDLNLSSYYYNTNNSSRNTNGVLTSHSIATTNDANGSNTTVNVQTNETSYSHCGYSNLTMSESSVISSPMSTGNESLLSDTSLLSTSDMSDIEIHNSSSSSSPPSSSSSLSSSNVERTSPNNCDYLVNSNSDSSESSDNSISPPPQNQNDGNIVVVTSSSSISSSSISSSSSSNSSTLCWSKISSSIPPPSSSIAPLPLNQHNNNLKDSPHLNPSQNHTTFVQQESQCGMESRLSEFTTRSHSNFNNPHHHNLPMDSLISANYSNSL